MKKRLTNKKIMNKWVSIGNEHNWTERCTYMSILDTANNLKSELGTDASIFQKSYTLCNKEF